jgi:hypothetical protein
MLDIHVHEASSLSTLKEDIKNWLIGLKLVKSDVVEEVKDGVLLCELINRLEGRNEVIKGMHKTPKNRSAVQVNVNKALSYLRGIEKLNSKHLWSANEIIQGDEETIFGLLQNIQEFYSIRRSASASKSVKVLSNRVFSNVSFEREVEIIEKNENSNVKAWVANLGLSKYLMNEKKHFLDDPCRNGVLLAEVLGKLEGSEVSGVFNPKSYAAAQNNYEKCLKFIYEKHPTIAAKYLKEIEKFLESDLLLWRLLEELISIPRAAPKANNEFPYSKDEIASLEASVTQWASLVLGKLFESFEDLVGEVSNGHLLSEIIGKCGFPVTGITKNPKTLKVKQANIEKSLECLRRISRMSQKFLFRVEELAEGNHLVTLGILEDLHRFYDGLPARKRGPNYHLDGPYLGKKSSRLSPLRNISSLLNKSYESPKTCCSTKRVREDFIPRQKFLNFEHVPNTNEFDWIFSLGIQINSLDLMAEEIEEFSNGVLLCQIVEKLERKAVTGFQPRPKGNAAFLYNVGKALKVLKEKPSFPSCLMFIDEDVVKGKGEIVRELLRAIFKVYKPTIKTQIKFYNPEKVNLTFV